jgi:hypothetical protein
MFRTSLNDWEHDADCGIGERYRPISACLGESTNIDKDKYKFNDLCSQTTQISSTALRGTGGVAGGLECRSEGTTCEYSIFSVGELADW